MEANCLGRNLFRDMNTHLLAAKKFYSKIGDADDFERDLGTYLRDGYVFASPQCVILGKPVRRDGGSPDSQWWDDEKQCDAWFVKFAAGEGMFSEFKRAMPFELPFIGWMRALKQKPVMYWRLDQILRRS